MVSLTICSIKPMEKRFLTTTILDIDAAVNLIDEFDELTFAILKHNNACVSLPATNG